MKAVARSARKVVAPPEDPRRVRLRDIHAWLVAQDAAQMAAMAEHADETRLALIAIERWFKDYAEAFKRRDA